MAIRVSEEIVAALTAGDVSAVRVSSQMAAALTAGDVSAVRVTSQMIAVLGSTPVFSASPKKFRVPSRVGL